MKGGFGELSELERQTLFVGLDNSNHASERVGEIIAATFSFERKDSIVTDFGRGRDYRGIDKWLNNPQTPRDYRFGVLIDEKYNHIHQNIPIATPSLVLSFLKTLDFAPPNLNVYIDGILYREHKEFLRAMFKDVFKNIIIENFIKKRKVHKCPPLVYAADVISNQFYSRGFFEITEHPKFVLIDTGS